MSQPSPLPPRAMFPKRLSTIALVAVLILSAVTAINSIDAKHLGLARASTLVAVVCYCHLFMSWVYYMEHQQKSPLPYRFWLKYQVASLAIWAAIVGLPWLIVSKFTLPQSLLDLISIWGVGLIVTFAAPAFPQTQNAIVNNAINLAGEYFQRRKPAPAVSPSPPRLEPPPASRPASPGWSRRAEKNLPIVADAAAVGGTVVLIAQAQYAQTGVIGALLLSLIGLHLVAKRKSSLLGWAIILMAATALVISITYVAARPLAHPSP